MKSLRRFATDFCETRAGDPKFICTEEDRVAGFGTRRFLEFLQDSILEELEERRGRPILFEQNVRETFCFHLLRELCPYIDLAACEFGTAGDPERADSPAFRERIFEDLETASQSDFRHVGQRQFIAQVRLIRSILFHHFFPCETSDLPALQEFRTALLHNLQE